MSEPVSEVVQVRMRENTLAQLDKLKAIVKAPSRSDAVRRALDIVDMLIDSTIRGDSILIERKNGKTAQLLIPGLNK